MRSPPHAVAVYPTPLLRCTIFRRTSRPAGGLQRASCRRAASSTRLRGRILTGLAFPSFPSALLLLLAPYVTTERPPEQENTSTALQSVTGITANRAAFRDEWAQYLTGMADLQRNPFAI